MESQNRPKLDYLQKKQIYGSHAFNPLMLTASKSSPTILMQPYRQKHN